MITGARMTSPPAPIFPFMARGRGYPWSQTIVETEGGELSAGCAGACIKHRWGLWWVEITSGWTTG